MKTLVFSLIAVLGLSLPVFAHTETHDFKIFLTVRGAPVLLYDVKGVNEKVAKILCDNVMATVKAWKLAPGTDPLVLETATGGSVVLMEKSVVDSIFCEDVTPQAPPKVEKKPCWRLVPHCGSGRCGKMVYVYE